MASGDEKTQLAWVYLSVVTERADPRLSQFIEMVGPVRAARAIWQGQVTGEIARITSRRALSVDPHALLEHARHRSIRFVSPSDPQFPHMQFAGLQQGVSVEHARADAVVAPRGLWLRGGGDLDQLATDSIAIVGTRAPTSDGVNATRLMTEHAAEQDIPVISGGAHGVDSVAHRASLHHKRPTLAVLAHGLDCVYPAAHRELFEQIAQHGLLISEYPPGWRPARHRFLQRNRLIAALSRMTLVTQAPSRSGALNTARLAADLHRDVAALPGPISCVASAGTNALISSHRAVSLSDPDDLLDMLRPVGEGTPPRRCHSHTHRVQELEYHQVVDAVPFSRPVTADEIVSCSDVAAEIVRDALARAVRQGVMRCRDGRYQRVSEDN